jgi:hypothetical protein
MPRRSKVHNGNNNRNDNIKQLQDPKENRVRFIWYNIYWDK